MWNDNEKIAVVLDEMNNGKHQYPCLCPVCNISSAHIYIHRHNDMHCGIWTWCSSCHSYSHMSGETPSWWKNPDFIDDNLLCSDPEYLNEFTSDIDAWVNNIVPKKKVSFSTPFTMEDSFKVKLSEDFQGIPAGTIGMLVVKNDFKSIIINFIDTDGKIYDLDIVPEKVLSIFDVIQ